MVVRVHVRNPDEREPAHDLTPTQAGRPESNGREETWERRARVQHVRISFPGRGRDAERIAAKTTDKLPIRALARVEQRVQLIAAVSKLEQDGAHIPVLRWDGGARP